VIGKGTMMPDIVVLSNDGKFKKQCLEYLDDGNFRVRLAESSAQDWRMLFICKDADAVVIHAASLEDRGFKILEYLKRFHPRVATLMVLESREYWNDFSYWAADVCTIESPDLGDLKSELKAICPDKRSTRIRIKKQTFMLSDDDVKQGSSNSL